MRVLLKILKWIFISVFGLIVIASVTLAIIGFPKPGAITADNVPKTSITNAFPIINAMSQSNEMIRFDSWNYNGGLYVMMYSNLASRYYSLSEPGAEPTHLEGIPDNAHVVFNPNADIKNAIYAADNNGDENYQIHLYDFESSTSSLISDGENPHYTAVFAPSGDQLLFTGAKRNKQDHDLYVMNLNDTSSEKLLFEGEGTIYVDSYSPDGKKAIFREGAATKTPYIIDISSGELTPLSLDNNSDADYGVHQWSKDGTEIYYVAAHSADFTNVHVRNLLTNEDKNLTASIKWDVVDVKQSPDGKWLAIVVNEDGVNALYTYDLLSNTLNQVDNLPEGSVIDASFHLNKNSMLGFNFRYHSGENSIFSYELETDKTVQWFDAKKEDNFPETEIVRYPTFDIDELTGQQRKITAFLHRPKKDIEQPFPVIINIHGGPSSHVTPQRNLLIEVDLNRGYAVIEPNVRGSTGYGKTFENLDNGVLRENAVKDIGALLDWISTQPDLDAERVVVRGASYGGYMAMASAVHYSDRLVGASSWVGFSNFVTALNSEDTSIDRELDIQEFGDISNSEMREFLESISPSNNTDKINIPLFLVQGEKDARVPVNEARQMVEALRKDGKEVWYIEAANEGHVMQNPFNFLYSKTTEFSFFDTVTSK